MDSPVRRAFLGAQAGRRAYYHKRKCSAVRIVRPVRNSLQGRLGILELTRMKRIIRASVAGLCFLTASLAITGALYEIIGRWHDARRFPQRGHLVQTGAIRMNIDCSGQGSPTVILESGSGGPSVDWLMVQPEVAKFARVCSYDRAGYGWSDSGPEPRSSLRIARELKELLQAAGEKGPYVLVGHSMGGYDVRVYTGQYANDVAGIVLVDASHEDQDVRAPESIRKWSQDDRKHSSWKKLKYFIQLHLGWARLTADGDAPAFWPKAFRQEEEFLTLPTKHQFAVIDEDQVFSTLSAAQVRGAGNLGDRPLIVLTATRQDDIAPEIPPKDAEAEEDLWVHQLQPALARLSTHGKQVVVDSSHEMPTEHPEVVISAIHEVWLAVH
jgi:pimeloyl-ACP methyl ester carboxylesterase